jgi:hypothetical protein
VMMSKRAIALVMVVLLVAAGGSTLLSLVL